MADATGLERLKTSDIDPLTELVQSFPPSVLEFQRSWSAASVNLKPGDIVHHLRLGPARVVEVTSDHISVRSRNGEGQKLSSVEAERQLLPAPPDGFYALLCERDVNTDFLRDHIDDVVLRIMRDRRRRSVTLEEVKRELTPILARGRKGWNSWWSSARKQLLATGRVTVDTKKKNVFCATESTAAPPAEDWPAQIRQASTPRALLSVAKNLEFASEEETTTNASTVASRAQMLFASAAPQERDFLEALCCLCYVLPQLDKGRSEAVLAAIDQKDFTRLYVPADLEDELSIALSRLGRSSKLPDLAGALLSHPSPHVQSRAFGALNTEKHRLVLKTTLLDWLRNPGDRPLPKPALYLRDEFLRYVRAQDVVALYRHLIGTPATAAVPAIREHLARSATAILSSPHSDDDLRMSVFRSRLISDDVKCEVARGYGAREQLASLLVAKFNAELLKPLICVMENLRPEEEMPPWEPLLRILRSADSPELFRVLVKRVGERLESSMAASVFRAAAQISDLLSIAEEHYGDLKTLVENALERFGRRIPLPSTESLPQALIRGARAEVDAARLDARRESDKLAKRNAELVSELAAAHADNRRLTELVETVKSSTAFDRREIEATSKADAIRPFLLLLDDLERQATSPSVSAASLISHVENAISRAGFKRIGAPGAVIVFDETLHEFLEDPRSVPATASVRVVRPGYMSSESGIRRILRRALVRPAW